MTTTLDATFDGLVIRPDEPLALPPNTRLRVTLESLQPVASEPGAFIRAALGANLPGPADGSSRLDDYLYDGKALLDE